jgi:alpha-N-arabinofuranosidase
MRDWIDYMTFDGDSELANLRRKNGRDKPWKVKYFGVGNENWGCGGEMRPEYYADLFRRYASFCRDFGGNKLVRVACGPGGLNETWTRVMMDRAANQMQAYSLHFYTVWPEWNKKTPATGFGEKEWFEILRECLNMEGALNETEAIMDRVDPNKRIELYADEWGSWYRVDEGHPGYGLYQQNSLRDALLAGLTFHIFGRAGEGWKGWPGRGRRRLLLHQGLCTKASKTFRNLGDFDLDFAHRRSTEFRRQLDGRINGRFRAMSELGAKPR